MVEPLRKAVLALYGVGWSTRQIADELDLSSTWVSTVVRRAGLARTKSQAAYLWDRGVERTLRNSRDRARRIWIRVNGPIPSSIEIHHRNGDWRDNRIENLEALSKEAHLERHGGVAGRYRT